MNANLPQSVVERLKVERERIENGAFSSALNVGEMLLMRQSGYRVLGQVMGACVWKLAGQRASFGWGANDYPSKGLRVELDVTSQSIARARDVAAERLSEEARLLGAHGVVGVRVHWSKTEVPKAQSFKLQNYPSSYEWKIVLTGTAVIGPAVSSSHVAPVDAPFTSHLSGEETWKLERAGYAPRALVTGNCVLLQIVSNFMRQRLLAARFQGKAGNFEVTQYTNALYAARKTALERLERAAHNCGAHSVIGVQIETQTYADIAELGWAGEVAKPYQIFSLSAIGTAVCALPRAASNSIQTVVPLS